jgi:hypothetical protein
MAPANTRVAATLKRPTSKLNLIKGPVRSERRMHRGGTALNSSALELRITSACVLEYTVLTQSIRALQSGLRAQIWTPCDPVGGHAKDQLARFPQASTVEHDQHRLASGLVSRFRLHG